MEVTIGPATSFAAACILLVLLLVAAQLCLTINSVQVSLPENFVKLLKASLKFFETLAIFGNYYIAAKNRGCVIPRGALRPRRCYNGSKVPHQVFAAARRVVHVRAAAPRVDATAPIGATRPRPPP